MLDTIKNFEIEISKAYYETNSRKQESGLENVADLIIKFCKTEIKPTNPDDLFLNAIISRIFYDKTEYINKSFEKDEKKWRKKHTQNMESMYNGLTHQLRVIKSYIADEKIIKVNP